MPDNIRFKAPLNSLVACCVFACLQLSPMQSHAENRQEMESWAYHKDWDKSSNQNYSFARSPMPKRGLYDNIRLEVLCKEGALQLISEASSLITSQGREFDFEYQIDKKPPVLLKMKTFPDSKRRGYTSEQVSRIVDELLSGQTVFIRINTLISTVLSAVISLNGANKPVQQVLTDCGIQADRIPESSNYQLTDFERDFNALSPEQKTQVLEQIRAIMDRIH
jgi:hypothetical protein